MAAIITDIIPQQNFELIRTRIGLILAEEIANQATLTADNKLNATVWEERFTPFGNDEMPAVNIRFQDGQMNEYAPVRDRFNYRYFIDVYTKSKASASSIGDLNAQKTLQRLCGIIRGILRNTQYRTLLFAKGFIATSSVQSIEIADPYDSDGNFMSMARITFVIMATEGNDTSSPVVAEGYDTSVKIEETEKGYKFTLNN
jgi:hypothetical protein